MADFHYKAQYGGKILGNGLTDNIATEINSLKSQGFGLKPCERANFHYAYKLTYEGREIFLGIERIPGMLFGTDETRISFSGSVEDILNVKSKLLEMIKQLELI